MTAPTARRLCAITLGVADAAVAIVEFTSLGSLMKKSIRRRIVRKSVGRSPFLLQRFSQDKKSRIVTQYGYLSSLPSIKGIQEVEFVIEEHITPRNQSVELTPAQIRRLKHGDKGVRTHWDLRWRDPSTGKVHAVAIPKAGLPKVGERHQVLKVEDRHGHDRLINKGESIGRNHVMMTSGYGRGHSKVLMHGKTFTWGEEQFHIWIPGAGPFVLVQPKNWEDPSSLLMVRKLEGPIKVEHRPYKIKSLSQEKAEEYINDPSYVAEKKYDGAFFTLIAERKGKKTIVRLISRRPSHVNGQPTEEGIDRSWSIPELKFADFPDWALGKKIRVEVRSMTPGNYASNFQRSSALLMMDPALSRQHQLNGSRLRPVILSIDGKGSYEEQRKWAKRFHEEVTYRTPEGKVIRPLGLPRYAVSTAAKRKLIKRLKDEGEEGVVFKKLKEEEDNLTLIKYIFKGIPKDLKIVDVAMMETSQPKYMENGKVVAAQKLLVEDPETSQKEWTVIRQPGGKPGSTDQLKIDIGKNPEKYIGGWVQVLPRRQSDVRSTAGDIMRIRLDK